MDVPTDGSAPGLDGDAARAEEAPRAEEPPVEEAPRAARRGDDPRRWWEAYHGGGEPPPYGYLTEKGPAASTRDELLARLRQRKRTPLVWTPEAPVLVNPWEVPYLFEALRASAVRQAALRVVLPVVLFAGLLFAQLTRPDAAGSYLTVFLFLCGAWAFAAVRELMQVRRLTPEGVTEEVRRATERAAAMPPASAAPADAGARPSPLAGATLTKAIGALVMAAGLAQLWAGLEPSVRAAGLVKDAVRAGEAWRMLTSALLHGDLIHFAFNFTALLALGALLERFAPRWWLPIVFLLSALGASAASVTLMPEGVSVGASGGLLGLFGFLVAMAWRRKEQMPEGFARSLTMDLALIAGMGIVGHQFIDNAAHAGGFVSGALLGWLAVPRTARAATWTGTPAVRAAGVVALATLVAVAALTLAMIAAGRAAAPGRELDSARSDAALTWRGGEHEAPVSSRAVLRVFRVSA